MSTPRRRRPTSSFLHAEALEGRLLLAATVGLDRSGVLRITGSLGDDAVTVSVQRSRVIVAQPGVPLRAFALGSVRSLAFAGRAGNDQFTNTTALRSVADGGIGNDTLRGGGSQDVLRGGDGDDSLHGNGGGDTIDGGGGDDRIFGGAGNDQLAGGAGADDVRGEDGNDGITGGLDGDVCTGGRGQDAISGGGGDDALFGGDGDDDLYGEQGDDLLSGNAGNDDLYGQEGDDSLDGDAGDDRLFGGAGDDVDEDEDADDVLEDFDDGDVDERESESEVPEFATAIAFAPEGTARLLGISENDKDKRFYTFTAETAGSLTVALTRVAGSPFAKLQVEEAGAAGSLLELEPHEGGPTTGTVALAAGKTYVLRVRSALKTVASYQVDLTRVLPA